MFPFAHQIQLCSGMTIDAEIVICQIWPLLTPERRDRIDKVLPSRNFSNSLVLENIYDRGNASAVLRSSEAFGFANVHMIESGEKFKESQRTTAGADKWVEVTKWKSTKTFIDQIKSEGKQLLVTHLSSQARPISEIDFSKPTALVFGNEKNGASPEMIEAADACVILPMVGFVQSYNISVAAALALYHQFLDRSVRTGKSGDLNLEQIQILRAVYALRTLDSAEKILEQWIERKVLV